MKSDGVLASISQIFLRLVALHGIEPDGFMRQVGIDPVLAQQPGARLPVAVVNRAVERAAELIPDPAFALRAGECWHPSYLGAFGYAWLSSGSLRTGLKRLERYTRVLSSVATHHCVEEADGLRVVCDHGRGDAPIGRVVADTDLSILMAMCRFNCAGELNPVSVTLRRARPANPAPWLSFFGCPVQFGAGHDSFVLNLETAGKALPSANSEMAATFDEILCRQLAEIAPEDLPARCKALLLQQLTSGDFSKNELAEALNMGTRTLQRRLSDAGLTYNQLLDETRFQLAQKYLDDQRRSVTEITFLLGFSEQSAFTRAFKRWSGKAPSSYRSHPLAAA